MIATRGILWGGLALAALALLCALRSQGLSLDLSGSASRMVFLAAIIVLSALRHRLPDGRLVAVADFLECFCLLTLVSLVGGVASYAVAAGSTGYTDDLLAAMDRRMGFDWVGQFAFLSRHPMLAKVTELAYYAIFLSPPVILAGLVWSGRTARAHTFILAFAIALAVTIAIFHFFPARGPVVQYLSARPDLMPAATMLHIDVINHLREGTLTRISPDALIGIVAFPSFHAASALLFIWAAWPVRHLRLPILIVNLTMLYATPIDGMHYLIDIVGGLAVATGAILVTGLRLPRSAPSRRRRTAAA